MPLPVQEPVSTGETQSDQCAFEHCGICHQLVTSGEAKLLGCLHTFCTACIERSERKRLEGKWSKFIGNWSKFNGQLYSAKKALEIQKAFLLDLLDSSLSLILLWAILYGIEHTVGYRDQHIRF